MKKMFRQGNTKNERCVHVTAYIILALDQQTPNLWFQDVWATYIPTAIHDCNIQGEQRIFRTASTMQYPRPALPFSTGTPVVCVVVPDGDGVDEQSWRHDATTYCPTAF